MLIMDSSLSTDRHEQVIVDSEVSDGTKKTDETVSGQQRQQKLEQLCEEYERLLKLMRKHGYLPRQPEVPRFVRCSIDGRGGPKRPIRRATQASTDVYDSQRHNLRLFHSLTRHTTDEFLELFFEVGQSLPALRSLSKVNQLLMVLEFLGHYSEYSVIASNFHVDVSTVSRVLNQCVYSRRRTQERGSMAVKERAKTALWLVFCLSKCDWGTRLHDFSSTQR